MTAAIFQSIQHDRLFGQSRRRVRAVPFALAYLAAFATMPIDGTRTDWTLSVGIAPSAAVAALVAFAPWQRLPEAADVVPLLLYLASIALLREANGGPRSGYAPLVLLAIIWAAIFGRARVVAVVLAALALVLLLPQLVVGPPAYPHTELRHALMLTLMAGLAALVIRRSRRHRRSQSARPR